MLGNVVKRMLPQVVERKSGVSPVEFDEDHPAKELIFQS